MANEEIKKLYNAFMQLKIKNKTAIRPDIWDFNFNS
jgi:hypothetical protein